MGVKALLLATYGVEGGAASVDQFSVSLTLPLSLTAALFIIASLTSAVKQNTHEQIILAFTNEQ